MLPSWRVKAPSKPARARSATTYALYAVLALLGLYLVYSYRALPPPLTYRRTTSPLLVAASSFLPAPDSRPAHLPAPLAPRRPGMVVPNAVHYVYGLKPVELGKGEPLPYYAYLAMRSALLNLQPEKIYFHYQHLPTGPWWRLIEPHLTLVRTDVPDMVMGRPLAHFAHKADVVRLLAMKHSGGVYLDIDVFVTKSFDDLYYFPTTMGMEAATESYRSALDPTGLCNAVIISAPNAPFIDRWLLSYESFEEGNWAGHSVEKPWELARQNPDEVQVLGPRAFFWPMWYGEEIQYTHERDDWDFYGSGQYAYHAWESLAMHYLAELSPTAIFATDTSFHRLVRPFVGPDDERVFRELAAGAPADD
ncbi:hypothetical protein Q5752_004121 [Cryptotrichosporon argae]